MSKKPLPNYLRAERKRWALYQKPISRLLGRKDHSYIGRIERGKKLPDLKAACALEVIYGKPLKELLRGIYGLVEEEVVTCAYRLRESVKHRTDEAGKRQAAFYTNLFDRVVKRLKDDEQ